MKDALGGEVTDPENPGIAQVTMKKIAIVGGGITGLATAFYLQEHAGETIDYTLIEGSSRLGGKIISARERGFIVEGGPDSFLSLFRNLRSPRLFNGKCGRCEYRALCGGSRARAFAYTGDPLASDPLCPYEPKAGSVHNYPM